jgi:hypothetical protein
MQRNEKMSERTNMVESGDVNLLAGATKNPISGNKLNRSLSTLSLSDASCTNQQQRIILAAGLYQRHGRRAPRRPDRARRAMNGIFRRIFRGSEGQDRIGGAAEATTDSRTTER